MVYRPITRAQYKSLSPKICLSTGCQKKENIGRHTVRRSAKLQRTSYLEYKHGHCPLSRSPILTSTANHFLFVRCHKEKLAVNSRYQNCDIPGGAFFCFPTQTTVCNFARETNNGRTMSRVGRHCSVVVPCFVKGAVYPAANLLERNPILIFGHRNFS